MIKNSNEKVSNNYSERFEFVLSANNNIICQRYIKILGFNEASLNSVDLTETMTQCANMIAHDLKMKSNVYYWFSMVPQVFNDKQEMATWLAKNGKYLEVPKYVITRDSEDVFVWNGREAELFSNTFNRKDFLNDENNEEVPFLKLAFIDNGREVCTRMIDLSQSPRFVRNNIDLSNNYNKYDADGVYAPVEKALVDEMNRGRRDLIPYIAREIQLCCSKPKKSDYTLSETYGDKTYNYQENKTVAEWGNMLIKKTDDYFKTLY